MKINLVLYSVILIAQSFAAGMYLSNQIGWDRTWRAKAQTIFITALIMFLGIGIIPLGLTVITALLLYKYLVKPFELNYYFKYIVFNGDMSKFNKEGAKAFYEAYSKKEIKWYQVTFRLRRYYATWTYNKLFKDVKN